VCVEASWPRWGAEAASMFFFFQTAKNNERENESNLKDFNLF
jgi:hypothetical protein